MKLLQISRYGKAHIGLQSAFSHGMKGSLFHRKTVMFWLYLNDRQVQVFQTPMCSLKTRYHMEFDSRIHAIGKMIGVVPRR
ncbi:hypothetical protein ACQVQY_31115 [Bacillus mycoides]